MLSSLLCHPAGGLRVHSYRSPFSYRGGPTERKVPVTILRIEGGLWDADHEKHRQRGCSLRQRGATILVRCVP